MEAVEVRNHLNSYGLHDHWPVQAALSVTLVLKALDCQHRYSEAIELGPALVGTTLGRSILWDICHFDS